MRWVFTGILCHLLLSCSDQPDASRSGDIGKVTGEAFYRERMAIPPGASLIVSIESAGEDPPAVLAKKTVLINRAPPYAFEISYMKDRMIEGKSWLLRARIDSNGKLMFSNQGNEVSLTGPARGLHVLMTRAGIEPAPDLNKSAANASVAGKRWDLVSLGGKAIESDSRLPVPYIQFSGKGALVRGLAGCNQFRGEYILDGNRLAFKMQALTNKACFEVLVNDGDFLDLLKNTHFFSLTGNKLTLQDANKKPLGTFVSVK